MPLTHVCMWDNQFGYHRVTIEEAISIFPYGVAGNGQILKCELCGDNVILTNGNQRISYFRHNNNPNKKCEEKESTYNAVSNAQQGRPLAAHIMPIRLISAAGKLSLNIGFFKPPYDNLRCDKIIIQDERGKYKTEYTFDDNISMSGTTYLPVGEDENRKVMISESYTVKYENPDKNYRLYNYWPKHINGIKENGTFFSCVDDTKKQWEKVHCGGNVYCHKEYLLLTQKTEPQRNGLDIRFIPEETIGKNLPDGWKLYSVKITSFSQNDADYLLNNYGLFLSNNSLNYYPIYPTFTQDDNLVFLADSFICYYCNNGYLNFAVHPDAKISYSHCDTKAKKLIKFSDVRQNQLVSLGPSGAIGFTYLIHDDSEYKSSKPMFELRDEKDNIITINDRHEIDYYETINFSKINFDGKIVQFRDNNKIVYIQRINNGENLCLDDIRAGDKLCLYAANDIIESLSIKSEYPILKDTVSRKNTLTQSDRLLFNKLVNSRSTDIPINHTLLQYYKKLGKYTNVQAWLRDKIHKGYIPAESIRIIKQYLLNNKQN